MRRIGPWSAGGIATITAIFAAVAASGAQAGETGLYPEAAPNVRAPCGSGEPCPHISGYIKAGADASDRNAPGKPRGPLSPLIAGVGAMGQAAGAMGQAADDALNRGMFFLKARGENLTR